MSTLLILTVLSSISKIVIVTALEGNESRFSTTSVPEKFIPIGKCPGSKITQDEIEIPSWLKATGHNDLVVFRLTKEQDLDCGKVSSVTVPLKDGIPYNKTSNILFLDGGMVSINKEYYNTDQYCFSKIGSSILSLSHCNIACAPKGPTLCIPKCCPLTEILKLKFEEDGQLSRGCIPAGKVGWSPRIYSSEVNPDGDEGVEPLSPSALHYKVVQAAGTVIPITFRGVNLTEEGEDGEPVLVDVFHPSPFRLLDNGSMIILVKESESTSKPGECGEVMHRYSIHDKYVCVDGFVVEGEGERAYHGNEEDQIIFLPFISEEDENTTNTKIKAVVVLVGIFFLLLTILMYLLIWPKHNIHGWTVFSFVVSMLVFFVTLATVHIMHLTYTRTILNTRSCIIVAILGHFTFLCALCWMSIMNFDFWATFRNLSPSQERNKSVERYIRYLFFAVGVPSVIVAISVILHFTFGETYQENHHGTLPGYGTTKCQLHPCSQTYYLYIPMALLLGFNLVMFSWTVFTLWTYKQKTQTASNNTTGQKQSWILFCKLFLIMGITWIFEVLSGFLNWDLIYFDIINLLQAVAIFFIFTAKRENLLWIYKRHHFSKRFIMPILRWKFCYVAELDVEQTEMTSAERNRTLGVAYKGRTSSGSDKY